MKGRLLDGSLSTRRLLRKSRRQECAVAGDIGGSRTPGSGNQWYSKGDVVSGKFLVECKRTDSKAISLRLDVLRLAQIQALKAGKVAVVQLEIGDGKFAVIGWSDWMDVIGGEDGNKI